MDKYEKVAEKLSEIVAEMKRLGRWRSTEPAVEKFQDMGPFGINTMSLEEWIQFVLVQRVEEIVQKKGVFPASTISSYAVKYFDGDPDGKALLKLIVDFDAIVNE